MRLVGLASVLLVLAFSVPTAAAPWTIDLARSRLGFTATQLRAPFDGEFKKYAATIDFDPHNLVASRVAVEIAIESVDTKNDERDGYIVSHEWMAARTYPTARFETAGFAHLGGERYEAKARLTMRGVTRDVVLPFTLKIGDDPNDSTRLAARVEGVLTVKRTDYGIGQGQWVATDMIGGDVRIKVSLTATRSK